MQYKNKNGYTIIETMIAVSLFIVIVMAGMGALLNANLLHQKSQDMRSIMDNLNFVMEDMSRNLRTGYNYRCYDNSGDIVWNSDISIPRSCANGKGISFEWEEGIPGDNSDQWAYYVSGTSIYRETNSSENPVQLTPAEIIRIDPSSGFSVSGAKPWPDDEQQPFVTIRLIGEVDYKGIKTPFSLQTSVSQREIDNREESP